MRHGDYYGLVQYIVTNGTGDYTGGACYGVGGNWGLSVDVNSDTSFPGEGLLYISCVCSLVYRHVCSH